MRCCPVGGSRVRSQAMLHKNVHSSLLIATKEEIKKQLFRCQTSLNSPNILIMTNTKENDPQFGLRAEGKSAGIQIDECVQPELMFSYSEETNTGFVVSLMQFNYVSQPDK